MGFNEESKLNDDQINDVTGGYYQKQEKGTKIVHIFLDKEDVNGLKDYTCDNFLDSVESEIQRAAPNYRLTANDRAQIVDAYNKYFNFIVNRGTGSFRIILTGNLPGNGDCVESIMIG